MSSPSYPPYRPIEGKTVILGMTGGIALFKVTGYARELLGMGAKIIPVMTGNAQRFVSALTFQALCGERVYSDIFENTGAETIPHISIARRSDLLLVMPATANFLAKAANGLADDLLSTLILAFKGPVLIHPSMNPAMFCHPATQNNISKLRGLGYGVIAPGTGSTACGEEGAGRLSEWSVIREEVLKALTPQSLSGINVVISAGPTIEPIDPVRFISNRSSGKMGYAMAKVAYRRGADCTLISGPVSLSPPHGVRIHMVETAKEMFEAMDTYSEKAQALIMSAAVADYMPSVSSEHKIKKGPKRISLELERTIDILTELSAKRRKKCIIVGFCAETRDIEVHAREKLAQKGLDLIAANDVSQKDAGFDVDANRVMLIYADGTAESLPLLHKEQVAEILWDRIEKILTEKFFN